MFKDRVFISGLPDFFGRVRKIGFGVRVGSIRPKPDDRIYKNFGQFFGRPDSALRTNSIGRWDFTCKVDKTI